MSKSNNFVGPGVSFTFTNRNFFRGAELFQLKLNSSYEVADEPANKPAVEFVRGGVESSLTVPRFISPIRIDYSSRKFLPKTQFRLGYNLQNRVGFFRLNSFTTGFGYLWKETADRSHELFPIDINYVRTDRTSTPSIRCLPGIRCLPNRSRISLLPRAIFVYLEYPIARGCAGHGSGRAGCAA